MDLPLFFVLFPFLKFLTKSESAAEYGNTRGGFDPRSTGAQSLKHRNNFCPTSPLEMIKCLVSCSGCRREGTHSRHPDTPAPWRTHAPGWPHPFGLHHPQSSLGRVKRRKMMWPWITVSISTSSCFGKDWRCHTWLNKPYQNWLLHSNNIKSCNFILFLL